MGGTPTSGRPYLKSASCSRSFVDKKIVQRTLAKSHQLRRTATGGYQWLKVLFLAASFCTFLGQRSARWRWRPVSPSLLLKRLPATPPQVGPQRSVKIALSGYFKKTTSIRVTMILYARLLSIFLRRKVGR